MLPQNYSHNKEVWSNLYKIKGNFKPNYWTGGQLAQLLDTLLVT